MSAKSAVEKENKSGLQPRSRPVNQLREHPGIKRPHSSRVEDAGGTPQATFQAAATTVSRARDGARGGARRLSSTVSFRGVTRSRVCPSDRGRCIIARVPAAVLRPPCAFARGGCSFHPTLAMCLRNSSTAIRGRVRPLRRLSDRSADSGRRFDLGPFGRRLELRTKCLSVEFAAHTARHLRRRLAR